METDKKVLILASGLVVLMFLAIIFAKAGPSGLLTLDSKCKLVEENYQTLEPYTEEQCVSVPYTEKNCETKNLSFSKLNQQCYWTGSPFDTLNSECMIINLDNQGGNFKVGVGINTKDTKLGQEEVAYIYPQQSFTFRFSAKTEMGSCYCNEISIPTKEVCSDTFKTRKECYNTTRYSEVTKTRTVEKCD
jgi:hypothetical protein